MKVDPCGSDLEVRRHRRPESARRNRHGLVPESSPTERQRSPEPGPVREPHTGDQNHQTRLDFCEECDRMVDPDTLTRIGNFWVCSNPDCLLDAKNRNVAIAVEKAAELYDNNYSFYQRWCDNPY